MGVNDWRVKNQCVFQKKNYYHLLKRIQKKVHKYVKYELITQSHSKKGKICLNGVSLNGWAKTYMWGGTRLKAWSLITESTIQQNVVTYYFDVIFSNKDLTAGLSDCHLVVHLLYHITRGVWPTQSSLFLFFLFWEWEVSDRN